MIFLNSANSAVSAEYALGSGILNNFCGALLAQKCLSSVVNEVVPKSASSWAVVIYGAARIKNPKM